MNVLRLAGSVGVVLMVGWGAGVAAQQRIAVESSAVGESKMAETLLARQVTLNVRDVSLQEAIDRLAASAEVLIQYRTRSISAYPALVSVRADKEALGNVLARLLERTALRVIADGASQLMIVDGQGTRAENGTLRGRVVHAETKQPVEGAILRLDGGNQSLPVKSDGSFQVPVAAGSHVLEVRALGFARQVLRPSIVAGETISLEIELLPSTGVLSEVVVTGTVIATERRSITTPITVITAEEIEKRAITRVEQLFRGEVPGLFVADQGAKVYSGYSTLLSQGVQLGNMETSEIYSRGSADLRGNTNPIKTFIDGVELLDPSYLGTIDPQSIERIEIVTGPQAATIYGSGALGGVMQIFTKRGANKRSDELKFNLRYGILQNSWNDGLTPSHNHGVSLTGSAGPVLSYAINLSYVYTGQWQPGLFSARYGGSVGVNSRRGPFTVDGKIQTTIGRNGTSAERNLYGSPYWREMVNTGFFWQTTEGWHSKNIASSNSQTVSFTASYRASERWHHTMTVGRNQVNFSSDTDSPVYSTPVDTLLMSGSSSGARTTVNYNATWTVPRTGILSANIAAGANGADGNQVQVGGCTESKLATSFFGCYASWGGPRVTRRIGGKSYGAFVSSRIGFFDQISLTLGLRAERNSNYGRSHKTDWTPTNGVAWAKDFGQTTVKLLGSYGRSTRAPTPDMREDQMANPNPNWIPSHYILTFGNPVLAPEISKGPQGGFELYYGSVGSLSINHYQQTVADLIQRVPIDSFFQYIISNGSDLYRKQYQYQNIATIRQVGWEGVGSVNLGSVSVKATYSWNDSRVRSVNLLASGLIYRPGDVFRGVPTHTGNVTLGYSAGATSVTVVNNWLGAKLAFASDLLVRQINFTSAWQRLYSYTADRVTGFANDYHSSPGYVKTDLAFQQRLSASMSATMHVTNLTNRVASESGNAFSAALGRQTLVGLSVRFP